MAIDPIHLTRQLVDIESTTYCEGLAGAFLHEYLMAQRYVVERMPVAQPDHSCTPGAGSGERFNVYAALPGVTPDVVLSTHMDTVPPFFGSREDDEFLYGRGACDAKGIIAAQIAAADQLREAGVKVGLLFVVGEERDSAGATVANASPKGSKFLINGEPTDNRLALASKGALRVELRAKGRMAHSAYPELGESAIDKLVGALHDVLAMPLPVEPEIGPATLNIGLIEGGRAPNVIADKAEAHILIRLVGPSDEIKKSIIAIVNGRADVDFSLEFPFVRMRRVGDLPTMVAKFATDIPALTAWGEPFLLGPGSIHVAHTPYEKIAKKELLESVGLYVDLATSLVQRTNIMTKLLRKLLIIAFALIVLTVVGAVVAYRSIPTSNTNLTHYDAIIVLGTPANSDGTPSPEQRERTLEGVREYKAGVAPHLILTGGPAHNQFVEAHVMAALAVAQGVPPDAVIEEDQAQNTIQNIFYSSRIMAAHQWTSAEVVSSASHLPRTALILQHFPIAWHTDPAPWPSEYSFWERAAHFAVETEYCLRLKLLGFPHTPFLPRPA